MPNSVCVFNREAVLHWLSHNVPKSRIAHVLRVEAYAIELAHRHHLDETKTAQAALLHDLAKYFSSERLLAIAQSEGLEIDPVEIADPHLLHADVSAITAKQEFDVQDIEVLDAIRYHTLGHAKMAPLSCVVFLADSLEPGRGDNVELNRIREISKYNLYQGVWLTCDRTLQHLIKHQKQIHPRVIVTRNWAMNTAKTRGLL